MWFSFSSVFPQSNSLSALKPSSQSTTAQVILPSHVKSITSTTNPFVKHCVKLRNSSSYRHSHGSVLLVGTTPLREIYNFQELLQDKPTTIDCLLLLEKAAVPEEFVESGIHIVRVNSVVMKKLSGLQSPESIDTISLVRIPSTFHSLCGVHHQDFSKWFPSAFRILVLDAIQDPGNLGTLLRSSVAFGWDGVFLLPGCCDPFNEKALRASRGASFQLPMVSGTWSDLQSLVDEFQMKILAGDPGNKDELKKVSYLSYELAHSLKCTKVCLVLGSEGIGLSEDARDCSELVSIATLLKSSYNTKQTLYNLFAEVNRSTKEEQGWLQSPLEGLRLLIKEHESEIILLF
uniref:tRNA/rRNA methyltransferase (SpoU) family protein n=1 Tax=Tanacetum cinerariifolium TaxID=118510 RepID=A0A6L2J0W3_TANCI|nr:tRNA/rRNA methyltransferase (SpoU) family protein [Tanacetum cinerariifolium]